MQTVKHDQYGHGLSRVLLRAREMVITQLSRIQTTPVGQARIGDLKVFSDFGVFRYGLMTVLVAAIGYLWSQLTWVWIEGVTLSPAPSELPNRASAAVRPAASINISILTQTDAFFPGTVSRVSSSPGAVAAAPETNLDLSLFGIRSGPDTENSIDMSSAIIRTPDKQQRTYRVGETVMTGVTLERVLPDRVVLNREGIRESLFLIPKDRRAGRTPALTRNETEFPAAGSVLSSTSSTNLSVADWLSRIQLEPRVYDGRIDGFTVARSSDTAVLNGTGLQSGDVITAINDVRLISAERVSDVVEELSSAQTAKVELLRDGSVQTISLNIGAAGL